MGKIFAISLCFFACFTTALSQQYKLIGKVTNAQLEPLSFVTVQIKNLQIGTKTNELGKFEFQLEEGEYEIIFSLIGYKKQSIKFLHQRNGKSQNVILEENSVTMPEFKTQSFRKDKAEEIIKQVIQSKKNIKGNINAYSVDVYIRATQQKNEVLSKKQEKKLSDSALKILENKLPEMKMSEISLQLDVAYPDKVKEKRTGVKNRGNTESLFFLSTTDGDFSLYNNLLQIPALSEMPMLSPISYSGLIAYKYKTKNILKKDSYTIYTIHFSPTRLGNALIEGDVEIIDTSWAILSSRFNIPKFHMPEYDYFEAYQENECIDGRGWLTTKQVFNYTIKEGKLKNNGKTIVNYANYKLDTLFAKKYFNRELSSTSLEAYKRDANFWNTVRKEPLTDNEVRFIIQNDSTYRAMHSKPYLDSIDRMTNKITPLKLLFLGQENYFRKKERTYTIAPAISVFRPFLPGGSRIGLAGSYNRIFDSKKIMNIDGELSYGLRNRDVLGGFKMWHLYNPFSRGSINASIGRAFDLIYTGDAYINLFRRSNFYLKSTLNIGHSIELVNGLVLNTKAEFAARESISYLKLNRQYDSVLYLSNEPIKFAPYNAFYFDINVSYTPNQFYLREPRQKIILGSNYPTFYVNWRAGLPGIFNSAIDFNYLECGLFQKVKLGLGGISQYRIYSGAFLTQSKLLYIDYQFIGQGNPYLFSNPLQSFQLLDSTFALFKRFYQGHYIHHFNGAILNKIPLLKKLKLLEVAGGGILILPEKKLHYIEAFVGLEKIIPLFKEKFKFGVYTVGSVANKNNNPFQVKFGLELFNKRRNSWY